MKNYILGAQAHPSIMIGDFVVVEADRGEDIGVVLEILPMKTFVERRIYMKNAADDDNVIGRIVRLASVTERQFLPEKFHDEENVVQVTISFSHLVDCNLFGTRIDIVLSRISLHNLSSTYDDSRCRVSIRSS